MFQIEVGKDTDRVLVPEPVTEQGSDLREVIKSAMPIQNARIEAFLINKRLNRFNGRFNYRQQSGFDFYEFNARFPGPDGKMRYCTKKVSEKKDHTLYVDREEPWVAYNKEDESQYVLFDEMTERLENLGWTEAATKNWAEAVRKDNVWVPA